MIEVGHVSDPWVVEKISDRGVQRTLSAMYPRVNTYEVCYLYITGFLLKFGTGTCIN